MTDPKEAHKARGLRLIEQGETETFELGGTTFVLGLLGYADVERLRRENSRNGVLDLEAYHAAIWQRTLRGWSDLWIGKPGQEALLPYSPDAVARVVAGMPNVVAEALLARSQGAKLRVEAALGN